jgi:hypothetical protein
MPKVSGHSLNNSRFLETFAGDRFDLHWAAEPAVELAKFSALAAVVIRGEPGTAARGLQSVSLK